MKKVLWLLPLAVFFALTACGDKASEPEFEVVKKKEEPYDCNFAKTDSVWKYTYPSSKITEIYIWIDETTVKFEEYMNSYALEDNFETFTNVDRDEFFEEKMEDCRYFVYGEEP